MSIPAQVLTTVEIGSAIDRDPLVLSPEIMAIEAIAMMSGGHRSRNLATGANFEPEDRDLQSHSGCVVAVVDARIVGMLTDRDVVRLLVSKQPVESLQLHQIMTPPVVMLRESAFTDVAVAIDLLQQHRLSYLAIVDDFDCFVGLVTPESLLRIVQFNSTSELQEHADIICNGVGVDVTERKQSEQQLSERAQRLELAIKSAKIGIWEWDRESDRLCWDERMCAIHGINPEDFSGTQQDWLQRVHPNDLEQAFDSMLSGEEIAAAEFRVVHPDGTVRFVMASASIQRNDRGELQRMVGLNIDITDRKQAELALIEYTETVEDLYNNAPCGYHSIDLEGRYIEVNDTELRLLGYSRAEMIGKPALEFVTEASHQDFWKHNLLIQTRGWVDNLEYETIAKDGTIVPVMVNTTALRDADGNFVCSRSTLTDIRDRQTAEIALRESEVRFRRMTENLPGMIYRYRIDPDGCDCFTYVSPQIREIYELEPEAVIQDANHLWSRIHPDDIPLVKAETQRSAEHLQPFVLEHRIVTPQGGIKWVEIISRPERQKNGNLTWDGVVLDITDRKQSEQQLQHLSERLELAIKSAKIGIWEWDRESERVCWDEGMFLIYGINPQDFSGTRQDWLQRVYPDDLAQAQTQELSGQNIFESEFRILQPDGSMRFIMSTALRQQNDQGEIEGSIGVNIDITDRKQAEQLLEQQAQREIFLREITHKIRQSLDLYTIFDTACREIGQMMQTDRVGIFKFDPDTNFERGEFVAESVVDGFSSVLTRRVQDHCFGNNYATTYAEGAYCVINDIHQNGQLNCHTTILAQLEVRANMVMPLMCGTELWGLLCIHQCSSARQWQQFEIDLTNQIATQLAIAIQQANLFERLQQELSQKQQAQLQLTERNAALARATRLKDEFLANMSHELRTPLNAILGMTQALQEEVFGTITPKQLNSLQTIERSGSHLLELINDILDVAKIESGQIELDSAPTAIAHLCKSSLAFIKQQALTKRIQLEIKLPPYLPDVLVDERRIRQVLINLLNNAVKFTPEGGRITLAVSLHQPTSVLTELPLQGITRVNINREPWERELALEIHQSQAEVREYIRIAITDTGIGIAPEHINKLFQPFIQIDSALNRQYAGTGLGLALVKRIVEIHGGEVGLTSEVGFGSCFSIELPCHRAPSSPTGSSALASPTAISPTYSTRNTAAPLILLAEDNEANIATVMSYLEAKGYRLLVAKDGLEAIALAQSQHPDLILMDIQMPGMDGLAAMQQIRNDSTLVDIPILALTALAMTGDRERCLAAGANDYLSKPIRLKQLAATIQHLLPPDFNQN